jgi:NADH-quinone oxidoreductase subunit C
VSAALTDAVAQAGATPADEAPSEASGWNHAWSAHAADLPAIAQVFRDAGYVLELLTAQDRRADLEVMRVVYGFNTWESPDRHLIHADVAPDMPAHSITHIYKAADWNEREAYDMYGVTFAGHPDLKRILLPDDVDFHALLKDFGQMEDAETDDAAPDAGEDAP